MMPKDDGNRLKAVELAKRLLVDAIWKTANIEVDGITFPDAQEIFEGRAPSNMEVNDIIVVNNIKRAWMFLFENIGRPIDWRYVSEYNRILGEGLIRDAGKLRTNDVRIGGTDRIPELPTMESSHDEISSLMKIESPEDRALLMFCKITRGQWFNDGNKGTAPQGRTARHHPARQRRRHDRRPPPERDRGLARRRLATGRAGGTERHRPDPRRP
ncbi:hypothetical protein [Bifidobacterium adolescentis]|uniref:hypothetical protein n=1 Tax=Bifidobacterium adolescentis TaxID=1680 RepID=UPI00321ACC6B